MFYAYVLKSDKFDRYYYGHTANLEERLRNHNSGKTKSIKTFIPYSIVYYETFESRAEAIKRERFFKTGNGRRFIKQKLIDNRSKTD
jgi:putative endonuclease